MRAGNGSGDDQARRFRDAALPHLDDVYTLARYLLRDGANADDAVQECYLRALRYFDTHHGPAMKPWLFAILRNICRGEFSHRSGAPLEMQATAPAVPFSMHVRSSQRSHCFARAWRGSCPCKLCGRI